MTKPVEGLSGKHAGYIVFQTGKICDNGHILKTPTQAGGGLVLACRAREGGSPGPLTDLLRQLSSDMRVRRAWRRNAPQAMARGQIATPPDNCGPKPAPNDAVECLVLQPDKLLKGCDDDVSPK